jgi:hypothetical protein
MTTSPPTAPPTSAAGPKGKNDSAKFGASFGASFAPRMTINIQKNSNGGGGGGSSAAGQGSGSHFLLGEPEFNSSDEVRAYCNNLRAVMLQASIELAIASKILEARLAQATGLPGDNVVQVRMRARKVSRKLKKASDGAVAAAKSAVGAYAAFQREYADLMRPRPQRAATTNPFKF